MAQTASKAVAAKSTAKKNTPKKLDKSVSSKSSTAKSAPSKSSYKGVPVGGVPAAVTLASTHREAVSLSDFNGKIVVLYFYPKDNTPGCTFEGQDFKRLYKQFQKVGAEILGVSRDSLKAHQSFTDKCGFPFALLSDPDDRLAKLFDVIQMKSLYGRKFEGIERSTFVLDEKGRLQHEWRKVKVNGHAEIVLAAVIGMKKK